MPHLYAGLVKIEVYMKPELYERLEKLRRKTGLKLSAFVRSILEMAVDSIERSDNDAGKQE
ncbi:MAG: hypothetical protein DRP50_07715 [Thermotoga sp.]|nr:MAG: hypothetical protein DRP50_07715 [Thermotoga sp.]